MYLFYLYTVYLGYLFIAVCEKKYLEVAWLYTRRLVLERFKSDGQSEPCQGRSQNFVDGGAKKSKIYFVIFLSIAK